MNVSPKFISVLLITLLTISAVGCSKPETKITVHNMGPNPLNNVEIVIGTNNFPLGSIAVDQTAHVVVAPVKGAKVEVRFDGKNPQDDISIQGQVVEDKYGEISFSIKDGRAKQILAGHGSRN